jgi:hypothetical protein
MKNVKIIFISIILSILSLKGTLNAQAVPHNEYLEYLPLEYPRIIEQTNASVELKLYGDESDPNYRDVDPIDGIDDRRHDILMKLAVRFAPFLIQNTLTAPVDFKVYMNRNASFPLYIETWNIAKAEPELLSSDSIDFATLDNFTCQNINVVSEYLEDSLSYDFSQKLMNDDCKLLALLKEFYPDSPKNKRQVQAKQNPEFEVFKVMYFDFPGEDPASWKNEYERQLAKQDPSEYQEFLKNYVHPLIVDHRSETDNKLLGYELILQYWFFYNFNDGGNNHEGDWEHINVVVSPKDKVTRYLNEDEIEDILKGIWIGKDQTKDELVIKRIENYFHHFVMPIDFSNPNMYMPREQWENFLKNRVEERFGENELLKQFRYRAYVDDQEIEINTHPFCYIGGDNKGLDQIMQLPGGTNRDSHGSYPFTGMYKNIGPAGATEQIAPFVDHRKYLKKLHSEGEQYPPRFGRGNVIGFNKPERLEIVPDWERVVDLVQINREARQAWSWLILPLRWGYPATESPFAGIVKHVDTGNVGDIGPAFWDGWNRSMATPEAHIYQPHRLPPIFPVGFQDSFNNSIGFFNLTYPILLNLPPLDFLWRFIAYPFRAAFDRADPVFYPEKEIPFRFFDISAGGSWQSLDEDYSTLIINDSQYEEFVGRLIIHLIDNGTDTSTVVTNTDESLANATSPIFQLNFHIGDQFSTENSLRNFRSTYSFNASFNNIPDYNYSAEYNFWEYAGSLRYSLTSSNLQPYLKAGYGWTWYRLENVQSNGQLFESPNSEWFNKPSFDSFSDILPNTWHWGFGVELILLRSTSQFPHGLDFSIRAEYAVFYNNLGLDLSHVSVRDLALVFPTYGDIPKSVTVSRQNINIVLSLSY